MSDATAVHRTLHRHRILRVVARSGAHELRNIAQTIQMSADVLRGIPDAGVSIPDLLDSGSFRLLDLAGALSRWTAAEASEPDAASLAHVLAPLPDLMHNHPARDRLTLELEVPTDFPLVRVVSENVIEAIWAVVTNALEAGVGARVSVTITAIAREGMAEVTIEDDGPGLAASAVPALFTASDSQFGLAVARALLRDMGGDLRHRDTNHGTRFVASLPLWQRATVRA